MDHPILIGGATGKTGSVATKVLLKKGFRVRAFVRKIDQRSSQLESLGAEIFVGDLLDLRGVRRAFEGVNRSYFTFPVGDGLVEATAKFAQAALEAKAEFIVNMSQRPALSNAPSNASLNHFLSERVFNWAGTPVCHVQPTIFDELVLLSRASVKEGRYTAPFDLNSRFAPISAGDVGEAIAMILSNPSGHAGQSYRLYGPVELTPPEIASILSKVLGRDVQFDPISGTEWIKAAFGRDLPYLQQHFENVTKMHRDGHLAGMNDVVEKLIGRRPETLAEFLEKNRAAF